MASYAIHELHVLTPRPSAGGAGDGLLLPRPPLPLLLGATGAGGAAASCACGRGSRAYMGKPTCVSLGPHVQWVLLTAYLACHSCHTKDAPTHTPAAAVWLPQLRPPLHVQVSHPLPLTRQPASQQTSGALGGSPAWGGSRWLLDTTTQAVCSAMAASILWHQLACISWRPRLR
jgi:hypothetical protein